jgi:hypothetical protein
MGTRSVVGTMRQGEEIRAATNLLQVSKTKCLNLGICGVANDPFPSINLIKMHDKGDLRSVKTGIELAH